jgi:hypothetical protein
MSAMVHPFNAINCSTRPPIAPDSTGIWALASGDAKDALEAIFAVFSERAVGPYIRGTRMAWECGARTKVNWRGTRVGAHSAKRLSDRGKRNRIRRFFVNKLCRQEVWVVASG